MTRLCLILTLSLACLITHAQTLYPKIGITASVNSYRPPNHDMTPRLGFTFGLAYSLALSEMISVQAGLDYVQKSFETDYSNTTMIQYGEDLYTLHENGSDQYAISYLELPLLVKVSVLHDNFFVLGGFSIGMGLGGSHKYTYESTSSYLDPVYEKGSGKIKFGDASATTDEDVYFDNRWDVGFQIGFGALILKKLQIECRYGHGMVNLNKGTDSKNRTVQISLSTPIQLKR